MRGNRAPTVAAASSTAARVGRNTPTPCPSPHHLAQKPIVEKFQRILTDDADGGRFRGIERRALDDSRRVQVARVEARIHRG